MNKKIKILFIHHCAHTGGAELSLFDLVTHLNPELIEPVIVLPENGKLSDMFKKQNIKVIPLPLRMINAPDSLSSLFLTAYQCFLIALRLILIIRSEKVKLIHANSQTACVYAFAAAFLTRIPLLWHERDLKLHPKLERFLGKFCSRVIAVSQAVSQKLRDSLSSPKKISLIYNGIDTSKFAGTDSLVPRAELGLPEHGKIVLMVGQLVPWKRHEDFINAAAKITAQHPDVEFVIAGEDHYNAHNDYLEKLHKLVKELQLTERFHFTGHVDTIESLIHHCDCLVLPSENEPFGRILVETMAAAKPVVTVNSDGPSEIVRHNHDGLLVPVGDPLALAIAVINILDTPPMAEKMGVNGQIRAKEHFSIDTTAEKFTKLIQETVQCG